MPIYIRKKNVKIFKLYQNCRNDVQFNSSLRKRESRFLFFFVFRFTNKQIQKMEKRKSTSVFRLFAKNCKKTKNENLLPFSLFRFTCKNIPKNEKQKPTSVFRFPFYLQSKLILVSFISGNGWWGGGGGGEERLEPNHRGWLGDTTLCSLRRESLLRGAPATRMTGRGHLRFQRELLTSKRPS